MIRKELSGNCIDTRFLMSSFITDERDLKLIVYLFSGVVEGQKKYPKITIENKFNIVGRHEEYLNSSDKICSSTYIFIRQETTQRRKCWNSALESLTFFTPTVDTQPWHGANGMILNELRTKPFILCQPSTQAFVYIKYHWNCLTLFIEVLLHIPKLPVVHRCLHYDSCDVQIDWFHWYMSIVCCGIIDRWSLFTIK